MSWDLDLHKCSYFFPLASSSLLHLFCPQPIFFVALNSADYAPLTHLFLWESECSRSVLKLVHWKVRLCQGEGSGHVTQWVFLSLPKIRRGYFLDLHQETPIGFLKVYSWNFGDHWKVVITKCFLSLQQTIKIAPYKYSSHLMASGASAISKGQSGTSGGLCVYRFLGCSLAWNLTSWTGPKKSRWF